jgi:adenylate cyclase
MAPMAISKEELFSLLDERITDPSIAADQDRRIWQRCGVDRAVLVLDMSGFTRLTRARGILHFLTVFRRAMKITCPAIVEAGGTCVKQEADNAIGTFATLEGAVSAARRIIERAAQANVGAAEDEIVGVCLGVGFGRILELRDDVFGDEVNLAFKLGEDVARAGEVLLTDGAWTRAPEEGLALEGEPAEVEIGRTAIRFHRLRL